MPNGKHLPPQLPPLHMSSARVRVFMWISLNLGLFFCRESERFFLLLFFETRQDKTVADFGQCAVHESRILK